jgi:hypothetical protein
LLFQKNWGKYWHFLFKIQKGICEEKNNQKIGFQKAHQLYRRKWVKFAKNCNRYIDPWSKSFRTKFHHRVLGSNQS